MKNKKSKRMLVIILGLMYLVALTLYVNGQVVPNGATIVSIQNDSGPTTSADSRSDQGGTINTINLNSIQQNGGWKAYVGNVSGTLTLRDSNSQAIYTWPAQTAIDGEVYVSRNGTGINWSSTQCATAGPIDTEQTFIGGVATDSDSINNTYNYSEHPGFSVGSAATITTDTCQSTFTYVNNAAQASSSTNNFTGVLLEDSGNNIIYATPTVSAGTAGFNGQTLDFQVIIPDEDAGPQTTYFFYLDIT